jgi:hypothetical protein
MPAPVDTPPPASDNRRIWPLVAALVVIATALAAGIWAMSRDGSPAPPKREKVAKVGDATIYRSDVDDYVNKGIPDPVAREKYHREYQLQAITSYTGIEWGREEAKRLGIKITQADIDRQKAAFHEQFCGMPTGPCPKELVYAWELTALAAAHDLAIQKQGKGYGYDPTLAELKAWYDADKSLQAHGPFSDKNVRDQVYASFQTSHIMEVEKRRRAGVLELLKKGDFTGKYEWMQTELVASGGIPPAAVDPDTVPEGH